MIKWIFAFTLTLFTINAYAFGDCIPAKPTDSKEFCTTFEDAAKCHCINKTPKPLPTAYCSDMDQIYKRMIGVYKTLEGACRKHTVPQDCIDDWKCYREGGVDSKGRKCNGNEKPCPKKPK